MYPLAPIEPAIFSGVVKGIKSPIVIPATTAGLMLPPDGLEMFVYEAPVGLDRLVYDAPVGFDTFVYIRIPSR